MSFSLFPCRNYISVWIVATLFKGEEETDYLRRGSSQKTSAICGLRNIMNHKRLLSCCVEVLDSFNPRIHGVLEHLNTCLATKLVSKRSLLIQKSVCERKHLYFNVIA